MATKKGKESNEVERVPEIVVVEAVDSFSAKFIDSATFKYWINFLTDLSDEICFILDDRSIRCVIEMENGDGVSALYNESIIYAHELVEYSVSGGQQKKVILLSSSDLLNVMKVVKGKKEIRIYKLAGDPNIVIQIDKDEFPIVPIIKSEYQIVDPPKFKGHEESPICKVSGDRFNAACEAINRSKNVNACIEIYKRGVNLTSEKSAGGVPSQSTFGTIEKDEPHLHTFKIARSFISILVGKVNKISTISSVIKSYYEPELPFYKIVFSIGNYGINRTYIKHL